jgi:addiction module HigA family antidote
MTLLTPHVILKAMIQSFKDKGRLLQKSRASLKGRRKITADTALRLSAYFGNSADFWLGIQDE